MVRIIGFLLIFSVANSSSTSIDELARLMEAEAPGSVAAFVEWGEEESKIGYLRDLVEGTEPVPPGFKPLTLTDISNLIFYQYHPESLEEIALVVAKAMSRRILPSTLSPPVAAARVVTFWKNLTTLPQGILLRIALGQTAEMIYQSIGPSKELRFRSVEKIKALISIWRTFCIQDINARRTTITSEPPCYHDQVRDLWVLGKNASAALARSGILSSIRKREELARIL